MWAAVQSRSRNTAKLTGATTNNVARQFVYDRFLARLFTHVPAGTWVLKGGTALLARVRSARHSRDIDLFRSAGTLDTALDELRSAARLDLHDHLRFVLPGAPKLSAERPGQPGSELARVKIESYAGVRKVSDFSVDVVIGAIITRDPEVLYPEPTISLPGMHSPPYQLYPVADHIADKLCATIERHGPLLLPSSRVRDLVDLVVIARTQRVTADALREAITADPCIANWTRSRGGHARMNGQAPIPSSPETSRNAATTAPSAKPRPWWRPSSIPSSPAS
jgi:hypothetical protein